MARDTRRAFLKELAKVNPKIGRAFEAAIQDIRSTAQLRALEDAIRAGDVARALQVLQLGSEFFAPLDDAIRQAFVAGATYQANLVPSRPPGGADRLVVRFQPRAPSAEQWPRERARKLITEIIGDQRDLVRDTITEGLQNDRPYRKIATDLVGKLDGNQRKGGMIGLHGRDAEAVRRARDDLATPAGMRRYLRRGARDRRFDRSVVKALRDGRALPQAKVDEIIRRYSDRLLTLRGLTIARTEGNAAANAGRTEMVSQMLADGKVREDMITKRWEATLSDRTRDSHLALNGTEVRWGEHFVSPVTGFLLRHPHDPDAPGSETVNCRCTMTTRINWAAA